MNYLNKFPTGLSVLFCLLTSTAFSQNTFQKVYDEHNINLFPGGVLAVSDGYVLTGGAAFDSTGSDGFAFLMKINPAGEMLWHKRYFAGGLDISLGSIVKANDGGFLIVGGSSGVPEVIVIVKTDDNGTLQWRRIIHSYSTNRRNFGGSVIAVDNGYVISGVSKKNTLHPVLIGINNQGETLWTKRYSATGGFTYNFQMTPGFTSGDTLFACGFRDTSAVFGLLDAGTGSVLATNIFEAPFPGSTSLTSMAPASGGDLVLAGLTPLPPSGGGIGSPSEQWVCRTGRTGEVKWSKRYTQSHDGFIVPMSNDHFLLTARDNGNYFERQAALTKLNGDGEVLWSYRYGLLAGAQFTSALETPDGGVLAVGGVFHADSTKVRLLIVKTDANGLVAGCCRQALGPEVELAPVTQSPQNVSEAPFDVTVNQSFATGNAVLVQADYCPAPVVVQNIQVALCPGDSIVIDGTAYTTTGLVTSMLQGQECDTALVYDIKVNPNPTQVETISFCPGDSVTVDGTTYTQPGTFVRVVPSATGGCDTLLTYILEYIPPAGPSTLAGQCPDDISVTLPAGTLSVPVGYPAPVFQSNCDCPGISLLQTHGLPGGSAFPVGNHAICYQAQDNCGNQATCCFQVNVTEEDALPCDVKVNACLRFELIRLTRDAQGRRTYHIRVGNNCAQDLAYVAFQLPAGVIAYAPQHGDTYAAPGGRLYTVRNPNNAPIHSIRFSAQGAGMQGGESDIFQYTLPPASAPVYINALAKLSGQPALEVHLNTFNCPEETDPASSDRNAETGASAWTVPIFPNPVKNELSVDLSAWPASSTKLRVFNAQGQTVLERETNGARSLVLPLDLPAGVYVLEALAPAGAQRALKRFVVQ